MSPSTGDFGALDGICRHRGWCRNSAAECFHNGSGRLENLRALRTPLPHLRPRAPPDTRARFRWWRVSENGGLGSRRGGTAFGWPLRATGEARRPAGGLWRPNVRAHEPSGTVRWCFDPGFSVF